MSTNLAIGYQWPASAIDSDDMRILYYLREDTGVPINRLLSQCVKHADIEAIKKQFPPKKMKKKVVKAEKGAAVVNDKEVIEISGTWKPGELRNLVKNIREE